MKFVDKKGKLFGKISIIDLSILLIIILLCVGTYYKFFALDNTSVAQTMVPIKYDVQILGSRKFLPDAIKEGDILYDKVSNNSIGKISKVTEEPAKQVIQLLDGNFKECYVPERYDVTLTVEAEGTITSSGYRVNRAYELIINSNKNFRTKYANATGKIIKIY